MPMILHSRVITAVATVMLTIPVTTADVVASPTAEALRPHWIPLRQPASATSATPITVARCMAGRPPSGARGGGSGRAAGGQPADIPDGSDDDLSYTHWGIGISKDAGDFGSVSVNYEQTNEDDTVSYDDSAKFWVGWSKEF